ncbi:hypothetical protein N7388_23040 [Stutzerimonas stutzeri]|jgi:hypothetical protein|uniref:Uncharacterized protein n=1 Tax=Stutzerimonas stutzeri TaxID=316 RepID=A0A023WZJ8_STUST|nr:MULTISPECIES: hypothetical protein [Pseudomonadaceae]QCT95381.1 hypothetical protein FEV13_00050 [Stutzerimonas degradans]AHY45185.1 hypothetical protein UIB01_22555 [Stutzerimonas decontaminans]MBA1265080.1 hypothetical protein [Stutzerimonas stutzeri]MBA1306091.1 hypothetical protein [Stutzerimonas stutzeri]MBH8796909.1 hypothetical protein [Pseudomonas aeruginosa]
MYVNDAECQAAGLDPAEVARITRGLSRYAKQAQALGLCVFGGSGSGSLRKDDHPRGALVLASLDGVFDGGDGACAPDDDGLMRGEYA